MGPLVVDSPVACHQIHVAVPIGIQRCQTGPPTLPGALDGRLRLFCDMPLSLPPAKGTRPVFQNDHLSPFAGDDQFGQGIAQELSEHGSTDHT